MTMEHQYPIYLSDNEPLYSQPERITKELKPHQKAALCKAIYMEQKPYITYNVPNPEEIIKYHNGSATFKGVFQVHANTGIIGDIVGYGKTLIGLSIIADAHLSNIYTNIHQTHSYGSSYYSGTMTVVKNRTFNVPLETYIQTTLVVVPRGPVYMQWKTTIENDTSLKYLSIDSLHCIKKSIPKTLPELKAYLETFDLILIKNTTFKVWLEYLQEFNTELLGFARIMIDEAHDIIYKVPRMHFKFIWLITSSYTQLNHYSYSRNSISNHIDSLISNERMHYLLVKSHKNFVVKSFNIPEPIEHYYLCRMTTSLSILTLFVNPAIRDKINVNDISGAIRDLGGSQETETSLVESVKKDFEKDIYNKEKEILFIQSLDIEPEQKEIRLRNAHNELNRLSTRLNSLTERIMDVSTKTCPICFDALDNPLYLNCTHMLCGRCLFQMVNSSLQTRQSIIACPECRTPIDSNKIRAIVKHQTNNENNTPILLKKEDQLIDILLKKPHGRFLLFSNLDSQFYKLCKLLDEHGITHSEIKGSTQHMMNILKDFKDGKLRIILLNTHHAGCGIDISCATDVIIYHQMPNEKTQAIGRAQRIGRTEVLTIHNLCYPHELQEN